MSLIQDTSGHSVHYPADPHRFSFDGEVSAIFKEMARKSIPNFYEAHAAHARMLTPWMKPGVSILDVGASRGSFINALREEHPAVFSDTRTKMLAVDSSPDMCKYLREDFPYVEVKYGDIADSDFPPTGQYDIVCIHYVIQFLPANLQVDTLQKLLRMVKPGGALIYGHKSTAPGVSGALAHDEYIRFRMSNGYSREEIEAKTAALKGSMQPMSHALLLRLLGGFAEVTETFRFMMFSTIFAVK
jgi:tRNA (cmo5U34)-methyltransferase